MIVPVGNWKVQRFARLGDGALSIFTMSVCIEPSIGAPFQAFLP